MRFGLIIILLFVYSTAFAAGNDTARLRKAVYDLNAALIGKDTTTLKRLLHKKLSYGHSNGWIETQREVIEDVYNGKLVYNKIDQGAIEITEEDNIASIRTEADIDVLVEGTEVKMKLHILQVWIREKQGWLLISRQSTKI